jgi:hypothetical protein
MKIFILAPLHSTNQNGLLMARAFVEEGYSIYTFPLGAPSSEIVEKVNNINLILFYNVEEEPFHQFI